MNGRGPRPRPGRSRRGLALRLAASAAVLALVWGAAWTGAPAVAAAPVPRAYDGLPDGVPVPVPPAAATLVDLKAALTVGPEATRVELDLKLAATGDGPVAMVLPAAGAQEVAVTYRGAPVAVARDEDPRGGWRWQLAPGTGGAGRLTVSYTVVHQPGVPGVGTTGLGLGGLAAWGPSAPWRIEAVLSGLGIERLAGARPTGWSVTAAEPVRLLWAGAAQAASAPPAVQLWLAEPAVQGLDEGARGELERRLDAGGWPAAVEHLTALAAGAGTEGERQRLLVAGGRALAERGLWEGVRTLLEPLLPDPDVAPTGQPAALERDPAVYRAAADPEPYALLARAASGSPPPADTALDLADLYRLARRRRVSVPLERWLAAQVPPEAVAPAAPPEVAIEVRGLRDGRVELAVRVTDGDGDVERAGAALLAGPAGEPWFEWTWDWPEGQDYHLELTVEAPAPPLYQVIKATAWAEDARGERSVTAGGPPIYLPPELAWVSEVRGPLVFHAHDYVGLTAMETADALAGQFLGAAARRLGATLAGPVHVVVLSAGRAPPPPPELQASPTVAFVWAGRERGRLLDPGAFVREVARRVLATYAGPGWTHAPGWVVDRVAGALVGPPDGGGEPDVMASLAETRPDAFEQFLRYVGAGQPVEAALRGAFGFGVSGLESRDVKARQWAAIRRPLGVALVALLVVALAGSIRAVTRAPRGGRPAARKPEGISHRGRE